VSAKKSARFLH